MYNSPDISCDTLLTASYLLAGSPEPHIITDAAIAVHEGVITALGKLEELAYVRAANRLDLGNALILPGLINAHTHVSMTALRGIADDLPLEEWLTRHIFPRERHLTAEIVAVGALLGCAEMMRTGTSTFTDMYLIEDAVASAVDTSGLRCLIGEGIFAFPSLTYQDWRQGLDLVRDQATRYADHPRIRVAVMPHSVYTTTPDILNACRDLAHELDLHLHIHVSETTTEVVNCVTANFQRPVAYCRDIGLLGSKTSIAHGVMLDDTDLDILAHTGTSVAHCPKSNMKLASGVAPAPEMINRGIAVGLGTDGAASNNSLNMFSEMSVCALLHKIHTLDPTAMPASTVLNMATTDSAKASGWPELGRLAVGAPADLIALDCSAPNLQPLHNPISHVVYTASGHEVRLTMVNGNVVFRDGSYLNFDYQALLKEAQSLIGWVKNKLT